MDQLPPSRHQERQIQFTGRTDHHPTSCTCRKQMVSHSHPPTKQNRQWDQELLEHASKEKVSQDGNRPCDSQAHHQYQPQPHGSVGERSPRSRGQTPPNLYSSSSASTGTQIQHRHPCPSHCIANLNFELSTKRIHNFRGGGKGIISYRSIVGHLPIPHWNPRIWFWNTAMWHGPSNLLIMKTRIIGVTLLILIIPLVKWSPFQYVTFFLLIDNGGCLVENKSLNMFSIPLNLLTF